MSPDYPATGRSEDRATFATSASHQYLKALDWTCENLPGASTRPSQTSPNDAKTYLSEGALLKFCGFFNGLAYHPSYFLDRHWVFAVYAKAKLDHFGFVVRELTQTFQ